MPADLQAPAAFGIVLRDSHHLPQILGMHEQKRLVGWQLCALPGHTHTVWGAQLLLIRRQVAEKLLCGICHDLAQQLAASSSKQMMQ